MKYVLPVILAAFAFLGCEQPTDNDNGEAIDPLAIDGTITQQNNTPGLVSYSHPADRDFVFVADDGSDTVLDRDSTGDAQLTMSIGQPAESVLQTPDEYNSTLTYSSDSVRLVEAKIRPTDSSGSITTDQVAFSTWGDTTTEGRLLRYLYVTELVSITGTGTKRQSSATAEYDVTLEEGWNTVHETVDLNNGNIVVTESELPNGEWTCVGCND